MNFHNRKGSSPTKKRKANDGRAAATDCTHDVNTRNTRNTNDGGGFFSSWFGYYFSGRSDGGASSGSVPPTNENNTTQLDRLENIMTRMEEKLATVSNLESRCEQLEKKCSSLENMLESTSKSTKEHIDRRFDSLYFDLGRMETKVDSVADKALKRHEYNDMMFKNQSWEYSAALPSVDGLERDGFTEEEVEYLAETAEELKDYTTKMRRGEFPHDQGLFMDMSDSSPPFNFRVNDELLPHWSEFAAALKQFNPAIDLLPESCESTFSFYFVQLTRSAMQMIRWALMDNPFKRLAFTNGDGALGGMSVDDILDVVESNKHLRKLEIGRNQIDREHIERLCSAVRNNPTLVQLELFDSFEPGIGDEMLASLLTIDGLKLERLGMSSNNITSAVSTLLADFLATNSTLEILNLSDNNLNDGDAELIANSLRSNTTLSILKLDDNNINDAGKEAFRPVLGDESNLNAAADSNHICCVHFDFACASLNYWNLHDDEQINRGSKIYALLSLRNKTTSNTHHFGDIDMKILPNMLEAVQKYSNVTNEYLNAFFSHSVREERMHNVTALSIVYEVMRKWDKTFPLYNGVEIIEK